MGVTDEICVVTMPCGSISTQSVSRPDRLGLTTETHCNDAGINCVLCTAAATPSLSVFSIKKILFKILLIVTKPNSKVKFYK